MVFEADDFHEIVGRYDGPIDVVIRDNKKEDYCWA